MGGKNITGRTGIPFAGYKSMRQYWIAQREAKRRDVADRVAMIEQANYREQERRDQHYLAWIADRCAEAETYGADSRRLRESYVSWCAETGAREEAKQAWGRWMSARYRRRSTRLDGATARVYLGIGVLPRNP